MSGLTVRDLGRARYADALRLQERLVERVVADRAKAFLVLVEHDPPVVTLGRRRGQEAHLLAGREELTSDGIEVHEATRGGDVTYHGPGQLVGYAILHVRDVRKHLRDLEEVLVRLLGRFGVAGERREGFTGVWIGEEKVASIGVAVRRWVAYHGFALNVADDLSGFDAIVPCGIDGCRMTSLSRAAGREVGIEEAKPPLIECMVEVFGFDRAVTDKTS